MRRKLWFSVAALAVGTGLLVAASLASAAPAHVAKKTAKGATQGGTMNVNLSSTDFDFLDPALAYAQWSWQVTYLTDFKLLNYPDKEAPEGSQLQPEAATSMPTVSADGKTYTFTIASGNKFNTGEAVTAQSFADAINRDLNPKMQSPGVPFISDIVGADKVSAGTATTASGVVVKGNKLMITLVKPDATFIARISMPFFSAIPKDMPLEPKGVLTPASAGPYYVASWTQNRNAVIKRNPNYKGKRPHNLDQIVYTIQTDLNQSFLQIKAGQADFDGGGIPPSQAAGLAPLLGKQFFVRPQVETDYAVLNTTAGRIFSDVNARKAVNFAIDRPAMIRARGAFAAKRTTQILPPGMPGYKPIRPYPIAGANPPAAKKRWSKGGDVSLYAGNAGAALNQAPVLQYNLQQAGFNVTIHPYSTAVLYAKAGTKGEPFDAAIVGWGQDYPDPFDFIDVLFNGQNIVDTSNNNKSYLNVPAVNKQMDAAAKLTGSARYAAYGALDKELTTQYAPIAAFDNRNNRDFVSSRIGCYVFQPVYQVMDLAAACIK